MLVHTYNNSGEEETGRPWGLLENCSSFTSELHAIYNFSIMQSITMQYELYKELHRWQLHYEPTWQKDTKEEDKEM